MVDAYLAGLNSEHRRVADGEWGLTVPAEAAGGWPLDVGLRIGDGMLRVQAAAADFDEALDPWMLLWWNRQTRYVRFACTRSREVWVHADVPAIGLDERGLDRLLAAAAAGSREGNRYLARLGFAPLVVHRIASTSVLRRSLGLAEAPERMAVLRRARLLRAQRSGIAARAAGHGA